MENSNVLAFAEVIGVRAHSSILETRFNPEETYTEGNQSSPSPPTCSFRYMPGLAEGLEGVKGGEKREIRVAFPDRISGQGGDLEGKKAIFEVETVAVKVRRCRALMRKSDIDSKISLFPPRRTK